MRGCVGQLEARYPLGEDVRRNALAAAFDLTDAVDANIATRVKMGQTSNVYGVAMMSDGKVLFAQKEIKVTLGGCGG